MVSCFSASNHAFKNATGLLGSTVYIHSNPFEAPKAQTPHLSRHRVTGERETVHLQGPRTCPALAQAGEFGLFFSLFLLGFSLLKAAF